MSEAFEIGRLRSRLDEAWRDEKVDSEIMWVIDGILDILDRLSEERNQ